MTTIAVVDHGAGNLVSISQGLRRAGTEVSIATTPEDLAGAAGLVLPGVGTTAAAMRRLRRAGLVDAVRDFPGPVLGICIGLQLLFERSEENGNEPGLGLVAGTVRRLEAAPLLPHIGWNDVATRPDSLFAGLPVSPTFYFVHSFAAVPDDEVAVIGTTRYGSRFAAAVRHQRYVGVQFHPERSGAAGLRLLGNFVASCRGADRAA
ncbi:MAG: imidazole glycerol phosphate synthase subunit HisH [Acidimicrobiia bacterium]